MIITIEPNSVEPIYLQIYSQIVSSIAFGELKSGSVLPSSRRLAKDLGVNYHTVNKTYNLLEAEGFVRMVKKRVETVVATAENREEFLKKFIAVEKELINEAKAKRVNDKTLLELFEKLVNSVG